MNQSRMLNPTESARLHYIRIILEVLPLAQVSAYLPHTLYLLRELNLSGNNPRT